MRHDNAKSEQHFLCHMDCWLLCHAWLLYSSPTATPQPHLPSARHAAPSCRRRWLWRSWWRRHPTWCGHAHPPGLKAGGWHGVGAGGRATCRHNVQCGHNACDPSSHLSPSPLPALHRTTRRRIRRPPSCARCSRRRRPRRRMRLPLRRSAPLRLPPLRRLAARAAGCLAAARWLPTRVRAACGGGRFELGYCFRGRRPCGFVSAAFYCASPAALHKVANRSPPNLPCLPRRRQGRRRRAAHCGAVGEQGQGG